MGITRRNFLKVSGATVGVMLCPSIFEDSKAKSYAAQLKTKEGSDTTTICPYCACGCGIIVKATTGASGVVTNTEGDPDHPINEGSLCSKGNSIYQTATSDRRLDKVLWRPPYGTGWIEIPWFLALIMMALKIKGTRDWNFTRRDSSGNTVNRTEGIAAIGGAALDNEECYLYTKLMRSLGVVYLEHQARI
jgi:formate dehydrogenase major subunit